MQNNTTVKDLVLYVPPDPSPRRSAALHQRLHGCIGRYYFSKVRHYCVLLSVFFAVSVLARCVAVGADKLAQDAVDGYIRTLQAKGFTYELLFGEFKGLLLFSALAFMSGFTVFSYPLTLVAAMHFYYNVAFLFFAAADTLNNVGFTNHLCFVGAFSLLVVLTTVYFAETMQFYHRKLDGSVLKRNACYVLLFLAHLFTTACFLNFFCLLLLHI